MEKHNIRTPTLRSSARAVRHVFSRLNTHIYSPDQGAGAVVCEKKMAKGGTDGSAMGRGCCRWRRVAGKQRHGKALASNRQAMQGVEPGIGYPGYFESLAYFGEIILSRRKTKMFVINSLLNITENTHPAL
jgi:hypothetical protein